MRRSRPIRLADVPALIVEGAFQLARLLGGRYARTEGANLLVVDDAGRILCVRTTYLGPGWMLPGGRIERGETPHRGAERETREETGLSARALRLVLVDGRHRRDTSFVFIGELLGGELAPQVGEIAEAGWIDRAEIASTSPRLHQLLELIDAAGDGVTYLPALT